MSSLIFRPWIPPSLVICSYHILAAFTTSNPYVIPFPDKGEKSPMVILSSVTPGSACAKTGPVAAATNNAATAVNCLNLFIHASVPNYLDRKSVVKGKRVSVWGELRGRRNYTKKTQHKISHRNI